MIDLIQELPSVLFLIFVSFGGGLIVGAYKALSEIKKAGFWKSRHFDGSFSFHKER